MNALACSKIGMFDLQESTRIDCTLYDLIDALIEEVGSDQEALVVSAVLDLMDSGRIGWRNMAPKSNIRRVFQPGSQNNVIKLPVNLHKRQSKRDSCQKMAKEF